MGAYGYIISLSAYGYNHVSWVMDDNLRGDLEPIRMWYPDEVAGTFGRNTEGSEN